MRNLLQIFIVVLFQSIACYLAGWLVTEVVFIGATVLLWQGLFIYLFCKISKNKGSVEPYTYNRVVWYVIMPICSLAPPLVTFFVFIVGTLMDLYKVSGCISIKEWLEKNKVDGAHSINNDFESVGFDNVNYNPESNYPMGWKR
ncbi:entry exclusion protein [Enterobacter roggenkampii]|uniref:entry exclusion protein n=1 Tax=Enterobacteriaceae TaxID=543 RepID=UPI00097CCA37|nr:MULTISPECIES: entry exclusion protein [Enterobacteriaceae]EFU0717907.1 entry exclusion protein [Escherichia coli]AQL13682.1 entry exclusion protein [Klebsiella variicola]AQL23944.1 entry exclusion protein [Klebsiella variicola]AQL24280.1 entry exclusion protein [Klebsiella variicola]EHF0014847.1 entry exclusion protein [Escherichia coli]